MGGRGFKTKVLKPVIGRWFQDQGHETNSLGWGGGRVQDTNAETNHLGVRGFKTKVLKPIILAGGFLAGGPGVTIKICEILPMVSGLGS